MAELKPPSPLELKVEVISNGFLVHKGESKTYCKDEAELVSKVEKQVRFFARLASKRNERLPGVDP